MDEKSKTKHLIFQPGNVTETYRWFVETESYRWFVCREKQNNSCKLSETISDPANNSILKVEAEKMTVSNMFDLKGKSLPLGCTI